ncbi:conserved hypothetical protein [Desulfamplus magnetovallimortis]|uniref:Uncharacterized protein n=1 Tax=Desulfamplus magnetovallimortis TaxID=1246637 RepID=A0A1W1H8L2_9BACT|nr:hypothetical protein [Desulfamplus magnetovallimortis]SLM28802.1 conserved hypothetical protein [Desulfamplus magnetovallimortis]
MKDESMKKQNEDYELREDYDLTQLPIMPKGRYAPERRLGKNVVVLEPDLARAFPSDESVNQALRLILKATKIPVKTISNDKPHYANITLQGTP